jgi:hypothetical protein
MKFAGGGDIQKDLRYHKILFWCEQAGDPLDYRLQATLTDFYPGPMATGGNLFNHQDARNLSSSWVRFLESFDVRCYNSPGNSIFGGLMMSCV